jgi:hypothetical protein
MNFSELADLKERKKHRKRRGSALLSANPHVPRKYTFKKRIRKITDGYSAYSHHHVPNGLNGGSEHFELVNRSKNSSPVPNSRPEK